MWHLIVSQNIVVRTDSYKYLSHGQETASSDNTLQVGRDIHTKWFSAALNNVILLQGHAQKLRPW